MPMTSETKYLKCFANSLQPESSRTLENGECRLSSIPKQSSRFEMWKNHSVFPSYCVSRTANQSAVSVAQNIYLI